MLRELHDLQDRSLQYAKPPLPVQKPSWRQRQQAELEKDVFHVECLLGGASLRRRQPRCLQNDEGLTEPPWRQRTDLLLPIHVQSAKPKLVSTVFLVVLQNKSLFMSHVRKCMSFVFPATSRKIPQKLCGKRQINALFCKVYTKYCFGPWSLYNFAKFVSL